MDTETNHIEDKKKFLKFLMNNDGLKYRSISCHYPFIKIQYVGAHVVTIGCEPVNHTFQTKCGVWRGAGGLSLSPPPGARGGGGGGPPGTPLPLDTPAHTGTLAHTHTHPQVRTPHTRLQIQFCKV
jgi:hypothetical protein